MAQDSVGRPRTRRRFGRVRQRASGRWQAGYTGPDGTVRLAEQTFPTKAAAERWLSLTEADLLRGEWSAPERVTLTLAEAADQYLASRPLATRTAELYRWLLDRHILPDLDGPIANFTTETVTAWWAAKHAAAPTTAAKAYRLLSAICGQLVDDGVLARSPCRVRGDGAEHPSQRPVVEPWQVAALADAMPDHLHVVPVLAAWAAMRRGELLGLRRRDVDLASGEVSIRQTRSQLMGGSVVTKAPKSRAGERTIALPSVAVTELASHLARHVDPDPDAWVLTGSNTAKPITVRALALAWRAARKQCGLPLLHLHDLRHAGLTWAPRAGATTAELMRRGGHASPAAALRYQAAEDERDHEIARRMNTLARPLENG